MNTTIAVVVVFSLIILAYLKLIKDSVDSRLDEIRTELIERVQLAQLAGMESDLSQVLDSIDQIDTMLEQGITIERAGEDSETPESQEGTA